MTGSQRLNLAGLALTALIVVFGQLVWLPGGSPIGSDRFWIDVLDALLYALLAPPLVWFWAALRIARARPRPLHFSHTAAHIVILAISAWLAAEIVPASRDWIRVAVLYFILAACVLIDLALDDLIAKRRVAARTIVSICVTLGTAALLLVPTPYDVTYPGLAMNMHRYVQADQGRPHGTIVGLLVFQRPAVPVDWLYASVFPQYEFTRRPPRVSFSEQLHEAHAMKTGADDAALAAVAAALGVSKDELPRVRYHPYALHEGGPSHGAMLALTLIDQLTPGGVTNGWRVAGTGTIDPEGAIGPIGGIRQKAYTAGKTGADVFFVPAGQERAIRGIPGDMEIVAVSGLDEILRWLREHPKPDAG